ncbi:hypothetical protein SAMN02745119_02240 [Trichlorobacter thiogenes]|uniref:Uncharacterized protein n=1 Tax=Trichlorobacter thiogenes TaxID=115783 RepID=A0A1T4Q535_9BACT|nr:hypothetical protein [Trichlorobacter thiogenes]SJZ98883.1 hypothetical protein SAMN02745119_02240 [Trichlorobacter thiogenes]
MKKTIIGVLLLGIMLSGVPAEATTTCLCVGSGNTKFCGNGGVGSDFLGVHTRILSQNIKYFLLTSALQAQLSASGKVYDSKSGWFCWNGTLQ